MAPYFEMDAKGPAELAVSTTSELWFASIVGVFVTVSIVLTLALTTFVCCRCDRDQEERMMQKKLDEAIEPPPIPAGSVMQGYSSKPEGTKRSPSPKFQSPFGGHSGLPPDNTLPSVPRAGPPAKGGGGGKGGGEAPTATMALADSRVFDKPGGKRPPPSGARARAGAAAAAQLETMALADSKVFDKK